MYDWWVAIPGLSANLGLFGFQLGVNLGGFLRWRAPDLPESFAFPLLANLLEGIGGRMQFGALAPNLRSHIHRHARRHLC